MSDICAFDAHLVMISEDISNGQERVMVPVVNELDDESPTPFGVIILLHFDDTNLIVC